MRQINPSGKIPLNPSGKSPLEIRSSHPMRGAARDRHERAVGCGDAMAANDECRRCVRKSRVVLAPRRWCQACSSGARATVARKPGRRGEHGIIRKASRRESRIASAALYARVRVFVQVCTRDRGCSAHPAFPAPSFFLEGVNQCKARAHGAARMRRCACGTTAVVITREGG
jgi:hypothetical protein